MLIEIGVHTVHHSETHAHIGSCDCELLGSKKPWDLLLFRI